MELIQQLSNHADYHPFCIILADGTKVFRWVPECGDCGVSDYFTDKLGDKIPTPSLVDAKACSECFTCTTVEVAGDNIDFKVPANGSYTGTIPPGHRAREIQIIPQTPGKFNVILTLSDGTTVQMGTWGQWIDREFDKCEPYIVGYEVIDLSGCDICYIVNWASRNENTTD